MENTNTSGNTATTIIMVLVLVILVGFVVWFMTSRTGVAPAPASDGPSLELNVGSTGGGGDPAPAESN